MLDTSPLRFASKKCQNTAKRRVAAGQPEMAEFTPRSEDVDTLRKLAKIFKEDK